MIQKNKRSKGKIKTHYGMPDYYKYFKKNNKELNIDNKTFYNVVSEFNSEIMNLIIEENLEYNIPYVGSSLSIKKNKRIPKIINGKLYNTAPVDWVTTNNLWEKDPEAYEKKLLVRYLNNHTLKYVFKIAFKKYNTYFLNKNIYSFKASRDFSRLLGKRIKDENKEKYDTYLQY
jgi:hypothetical protein